MTIAIDVAVLLPPQARDAVTQLNRQLEGVGGEQLRFDASHHPHVTLSQHFVRRGALATVQTRVGRALSAQSPFPIEVIGVGHGRTAQTLMLADTAPLRRLHAEVMDALADLEIEDGDASAFQVDDAPARPADVAWVAGFRAVSAYDRFAPHITVGIGGNPLTAAPFRFEAGEIAICRLGRFCACRDRLATWILQA